MRTRDAKAIKGAVGSCVLAAAVFASMAILGWSVEGRLPFIDRAPETAWLAVAAFWVLWGINAASRIYGLERKRRNAIEVMAEQARDANGQVIERWFKLTPAVSGARPLFVKMALDLDDLPIRQELRVLGNFRNLANIVIDSDERTYWPLSRLRTSPKSGLRLI